MRITVNVCRNLLRKRRSTGEVSDLETDAVDVESATSPDRQGPHESLAADERRRFLWELVDELPEKERMAIVLRDIEGCSSAEVAEIVGSSPATVRSQISSARLKMRTAMSKLSQAEGRHDAM